MKTKKLLSFALVLAMLVGMLPGMSLTASAAGSTTTITPGSDEAKTGTGTMTITLHIHNFTEYKLGTTKTKDDTIIATCKETTYHTDGQDYEAKLVISAPTTDGGAAVVTATPTGAIAAPIVKYQTGSAAETETPPTTAGFHKASITVDGKTASVTYGMNCITYSTATNGTVSGATGATVGAIVEPTIAPATGYELNTLTVKQGDQDVTVTGNKSFVMPEANVTVSATFKKINSKITPTQPAEGGTVTVKINNADVKAADYGDTITLGNAPAAGYNFTSYSVTKTGESSTVVSVSNGTFTMPEYPVTVTGTFTPIDYTVTVSATTNGTVGANKTTAAHIGEEITLTVTPSTGYQLDTLTVTKANNDTVSVSGNKFTMPASNVTVAATFKEITYTVTANGATATVKDSTPAQNQHTATLNISDKSYDGTAATATVTKSAGFPDSKVTVGAVSYAGRDGTTYSSSATAPTDVGKYTASVTVGDKTVNKNFEIKPQEPISYISSITYNPATNTITVTINTITQYVLVTSETKAWANNWYVVKGNVTINGPVTYGSNVKLLLCDGASLTVKGGIKPSGSELTIYGQEGQTGLLAVEGAANEAALDGGTITVNGGKLKLIPGTSGTLFGDSASVTFNNGVNITAKNSSDETVTVETGKTYTGSELNSYKELNAAARAAATVKTAPTAKTGLTANGSAQALVNAGTANGGTMQYALGTSSAATGAYSTTIPTANAAGTYYVWYKAVGSDGDSAAAYVTVTVSSRSTPSSSSSSDSDSSSSTPSSTTTTTTTTDTTSNPDASTTDGAKTVTTTTNRDGSTTEKTTETATKSGGDGSKTEVKAEATTTTKSNRDGTTTAATTTTETATTTAADGTKTVTETKTEAKETLDKSGNGTVEAKTTETVKDASGKVTATTVTESKGTVETATDGTKTTTTTNTAVTTDAAGNKTTVVTTERATVTTDGNTGKVVSDESGKVVSVEAKVSEIAAESAAKSGETVTLPVTVTAAQSAEDATAVAITVPKAAESVKVEIPVEDVKPGTVAVIVREDGTEEIVKTSTTGTGGVVLTLDGGASVKVVDNTKTFDDVDGSEWYADNVAWASSREVMNGVGNNTFAPNEDTNRAMVTQILYNLDDGKASGAVTSFNDVSAGDWYADSVSWAVENGIAQGEGESFGANDPVSREQLSVMLYNYAGKKGYDVTVKGDISRFADNDSASAWASDALAWAVGIGIINGARDAAGNTLLDPQGNASRAQVTAMTERFCQKAAK